MWSTLWGHFALVCIAAVVSHSGSSATAVPRHKAAPSAQPVLDPELAEAEALAAQAEAEADGGSADTVASPALAPVHRAHHPHRHHHTHHHRRPHRHPASVISAPVLAPSSKITAAHPASEGHPYFLRHANKPDPGTESESPFSKGLRGGGLDHWGDSIHTAVNSLTGNATKKAAKAVSPAKVKLPAHASAHAKDQTIRHEGMNEVTDQHSVVRNAVRATVKEVLPGKRSRNAMRKLPQDVTRRVGEVAMGRGAAPDSNPNKPRAPVPPPSKRGRTAVRKFPEHVTRNVGEAAYGDALHSPPQKRERHSLAEHSLPKSRSSEDDDKNYFDIPAEGTQDFSQVEPGLAYGHGQPQSAAADQRALEEARKLEEAEERKRQARQLQEEKAALNSKPSAGARQRRLLHEVEELEEKIAEETKSESLAYMLGGVKMDLYQLNEKMDMFQKDIEDGVPMEQPNIRDDIVYPLSACMRCIFMLSAQYFLVYAGAVVCKVLVDVFALGPGCIAEKGFRAACDSVFYAPMLCVLFLGAHLRASQITLGRRGPQEWAETAMQVCSWSCLVQTLMVLAIPIFTSKVSRGPTGGFAEFLIFMRYAALVGLYAGFTCVCAAVLLMDARSLGAKPAGIWDDPRTAKTEYAPPVSVAMLCTITLTLFFFVFHLLHAILWSCKELARGRPAATQGDAGTIVASWEECLRSCTSAINMAPMLCILFMAARMRALQMDPKWGRPQWWAEGCFYICAGSVVAQALLIIVAKLIGGGSVASPGRSKRSPLQSFVMGLSYVVMAVTFAACGVVMCSVFLIEAKPGSETPPISPAMFCVMLLVALYLVVFICVFLAQVAVEATNSSPLSPPTPRAEKMQSVLSICKMAENTVKFGPMLAVLFVGARMRALQMSNQNASPQCWAQDAMYMASGAVVLQLCAVIFSGAISSTVEVDEDGTLLTKKVQYLPGGVFLECVRAATNIMLFGGVITVVWSVLTIRPETAQCAERGFAGLR